MAPAHESETIVFNFRKLLSTLPNYAELEQILLFSVNWGKQVCKQIGKNFCSFLFMLNFGNQFPFRILFRILSVIVVNCNLIISVMAAWPIKFYSNK